MKKLKQIILKLIMLTRYPSLIKWPFGKQPEQSPMGAELRNILMADAEFKKCYDMLSSANDKDLDERFKKGKINPIEYCRIKSGITPSAFAKRGFNQCP